jgi:hypothetical protein
MAGAAEASTTRDATMRFNPCKGKDFCTEGGTHCEGCGRSHEEIARTRELIDLLARFAQEMGYENHQEFTAFVGDKASKKVSFERGQGPAGGPGVPFTITR